MNWKRCSSCGEAKAPEHFHRNASARDGLSWSCKDCMRRIKWTHRTQRRRELHALFDSRCARCGNDDWRVLELDHVVGGGTADRAAGRVDQYYSRRLCEYIRTHRQLFQLLCANCHKIKTWEDRERRRAQFPAESAEARAGARLHRAEGIAQGKRAWWASLTPEERSAITRKSAQTRGLPTHCIHGHEFAPENTHIDPHGRRICRACKRRSAAEQRAKRKAEGSYGHQAARVTRTPAWIAPSK